MVSNRGVALIAAAMLLHATSTWGAQAQETPSLSFNGFGTAGLVHSNEDRADFVSNFLVPDGVGRTSEWSAEVDSRLGLQVTADLASRLSSVAQVVVEQRYDDTYTPTLEWANLKYEVTPDLYVRGGRIVLPGLMASEYRKVGYALPWVRPPQEVYGLVPITNSDGVDAGYEFRFAGFTNTLRFNYGRRDFKVPSGDEITARDLWGVSGSAERGPLAFHIGYLNSSITVEGFRPLADAFRQFGPRGAAIGDDLEFEDRTVQFLGVGARYDAGDWFVMGEFARLDSDAIIGRRNGLYLGGGYRFGSVTPYLTLARIKTDTPNTHPGLTTVGLPPQLAASVGRLNVALNRSLGLVPQEQESIALGIRWDVARNLALKTQVDYLDLAAGSSGVLVNEQPGIRRGGEVFLFSVTLDFVF